MSKGARNRSSRQSRLMEVRSEGVVYESRSQMRRLAAMTPEHEHLWVVTGAWIVKDPTANTILMDAENLMCTQGPGCYKCEEMYSPELAAKICTGSF